ncbi:MAG: DUF1499 domain-containing protein [Sedimenticola sp.]|uniref:DUF1499 domain-containing protein n=1 Tax=Sedimenticola thiotaurini TaxID=1543721 RepID=A0A558D460_9GAMM|nr:DUF1499 domain-containing protein [Sedimenticola sp.]MCW8948441.1 DUF1499 domain-containing protein [Sedimenticola sp.]TVT55805.1 MAG: DUF1499 domain-containing protein [Sedimenticola thiotaurini]
MKVIVVTSAILIAIALLIVFSLHGMNQRAKAPGLTGGILSKCSDKPNCVCSESGNDASHSIEPIAIPQDSSFDTLSLLKESIEEMEGNIMLQKENYIAATFTSAIFRFVDDLEVRIDSAGKVIHIRSASRVGYSDFGVNRERVEKFKEIFRAKALQMMRPESR